MTPPPRSPAEYGWIDPKTGDRWKVTESGVWLFNRATGRYHLSGWRSAVSDQLLRLASRSAPG